MTGEKKRKVDTFAILDCLSFDDYMTTNEIANKVNQNWVMVLNKLLYLEYKGYTKFIEVRNTKYGIHGVSYAWMRLSPGEEPNKSFSKSILKLLEFVPDSEFISTLGISKLTTENSAVVLAKLLYLESRRKVVCFRAGPKSKQRRVHYWKKLDEKEMEEIKDEEWEKVAKRYERECFRYND